MNFKEHKEKALKNNPKLYEAYKALEPEYELIQQIITARIEQKLTQQELADKVGMKQSNLSRIESGRSDNLTLKSMKRLAKELGKELHIEFK